MDVLLRAVARVARRVGDLRVRIVGDGPQRLCWQRLGRELGLDGVVQWAGPVSLDQLAREYGSAHVFCLPSAQEGFGIVFLEAMAAGLPVVAANAAAVPEVVSHGLLCEPGNVEEFSAALQRMYDDSQLRIQLAAAGRLVVRRYDLPQVTAEFLAQVTGA